MATTSDDIQAIRAYFVTIWQSAVPYVFDNEPIDDMPDTMWARLSVRANNTSTQSLGTGMIKEQGRVYLHVFCPRGTGDGDGLALIDMFKTAFHQKRIDGYRIRLTECQSGASDDDPKFYTLSATVRYEAQHRSLI